MYQFHPNAYINEFNELEQHFFDSNNFIDILPFHESLLNRFNKSSYAEQMPLLRTALLTKIHSMRSGQLTNMVIDVIGFIDFTLQRIDDLIDLNHTIAVYDRRAKYQSDINSLIAEANRYIESDSGPYIHELFESLKIEFDDIIDEIVELKKESYENSQKKKEALEKLKENIEARKFLSVFDVIEQSLLSLGSEGQLIASIVSMGANIGRSLLRDPENVFSEFIPIPSAIVHKTEVLDLYENHQRKKIDALDKIFDKSENSPEIKDVDSTTTTDGLQNILGDGSDLLKKCEIMLKELGNYVKYEQSETDANEKCKSLGKRFDKTYKLLYVADQAFNVYNEIKDDDEKLNVAYEAIERDEQTLNDLRNFENKIYNEILPNLIDIENNVKKAQKSFGSQSKIILNINNMKIAGILQNAKIEMSSIVKGFKNENRIINLIDKLIGGMTITINLYTQIKEYEEHSALINYITDMQLPNSRASRKLPEMYFNLEYNIKINIIIGQYLRVMTAFKQLTFPFASSYLDMFHLPNLKIVDTPEKFKNHTDLLASRLQQLKNQIILFNSTTINNHDHDILLDDFDNFKKPFYVWRNEFNRNEISRLISGEDITLFADVRNGSSYNAVKFKTIDINFVAKNESYQPYINTILESIEFNLTHSGISLYRCGNFFYHVNTPPQIIVFGKMGENGLATHRNLVYDKIHNGGFMLSPYTYWHLKISGKNLSILQNYEFDIELNGKGQYVAENANICETDLEKYYEIDKHFE